jgi:hypothetical protein
MKILTVYMMINIVLILITIITGFALHKTGKPYNNIRFTLHKLLTIGFVVFLSIIIVNHMKQGGIEIYHILFLAGGILAVLALLFSGGMMSLDKMQEGMLLVHRMSVILFMICLSGIIYIIYHFIH